MLTTSDVISGKILIQMGLATKEQVQTHLRAIVAEPDTKLDLVNRLMRLKILDDAGSNFVRHRAALYEHVRREAVYVRLLERGTTIQRETVARLLAQLERNIYRRRLGDLLVQAGNLKTEYDQEIVRKQMDLIVKDDKRILSRYLKEDFGGVGKPLIPNSRLDPSEFKISTLFRSKKTRALVDRAELDMIRAEAEAAAALERSGGPPEDRTAILGDGQEDPALAETAKLAPGEVASVKAEMAGGIPDAIPDATPARPSGAIPDAIPDAVVAPSGVPTIDDIKNLKRIGDYTVVETLGVGGMGAVFLGQKDGAGEFCAIKVLLNAAAGVEERGRFEREIQLAGSVGHPNVLGVIDSGKTRAGLSYMVVPALAGKELRELIDLSSNEGLAPVLAKTILEQVLKGLQALHDLGVVHRDMKPENVFVLAGGMHEIKIMDFGLARPNSEEEANANVFLTQMGEVSGSPAYIAPETVTSDPIDGRTDIYSLGIMMFEMLTGTLPLVSESAQGYLTLHLIEDPLKLADAKPNVAWPPELQDLLDRMMAKDRSERPTCQQVLDELAGGLGAVIETVVVDPEALQANQAAEEALQAPTQTQPKWGFKGLLGRLIG